MKVHACIVVLDLIGQAICTYIQLTAAVKHILEQEQLHVYIYKSLTNLINIGEKFPPPPTIRDLAILPELDDCWRDLGRALSIDVKTIHSINKKFSTSVKKQKELFRAYLRTSPSPSWRDILLALIRIGKLDFAKKVFETFDLPQRFLSIIQESVIISAPSFTDIGSFTTLQVDTMSHETESLPVHLPLHPDFSSSQSQDGFSSQSHTDNAFRNPSSFPISHSVSSDVQALHSEMDIPASQSHPETPKKRRPRTSHVLSTDSACHSKVDVNTSSSCDENEIPFCKKLLDGNSEPSDDFHSAEEDLISSHSNRKDDETIRQNDSNTIPGKAHVHKNGIWVSICAIELLITMCIHA